MDHIRCPICYANGDSYFVLNEDDLRLHQRMMHGIVPEGTIKVEPEPQRPDIPENNAFDSLKRAYKIKILNKYIELLNNEVEKEIGLPRRRSSYDTSEQEKFDDLVEQREEGLGGEK